MFGDILGPIHIGIGRVTAGDNIQKYELLRWRAAELSTVCQIDTMHKKAAEAVGHKATLASLAAARSAAAETRAGNKADPQQVTHTGGKATPLPIKGLNAPTSIVFRKPDTRRSCG